MKNQDKDTELKIAIEGYNCQSGASVRNLAEERIRAIEERIAAIKTERMALNREKHLLAKLASLS
jgi:hypothetical protein